MNEQKYFFIFPGQGSQFVGMGSDLVADFPESKIVFEEVDEALEQDLSQLMFSGDMNELTQTQNAQPAIMALSMAVIRILEKAGLFHTQNIAGVAGHSLGEYSALCAAQSLTLTQTARLLKARGHAMQQACTQSKSAMLVLLGCTPEQAAQLATDTKTFIANDNAPGQIVLSGLTSNLERAAVSAQKMGIRRSVTLNVAGGFHSPLMQTAADQMTELLHHTIFKEPTIPVYFNVTANLESDHTQYADLLIKQITAPVRWCELIRNTKADHFVECGPGTVLSGLNRRIDPTIQTISLGTSESIKMFLNK